MSDPSLQISSNTKARYIRHSTPQNDSSFDISPDVSSDEHQSDEEHDSFENYFSFTEWGMWGHSYCVARAHVIAVDYVIIDEMDSDSESTSHDIDISTSYFLDDDTDEDNLPQMEDNSRSSSKPLYIGAPSDLTESTATMLTQLNTI